MLDADKDGKINKNDAMLIIRGIGIPGFDSDFDSVITGMNTDSSLLSFDDVLNVAISLKKTQISTVFNNEIILLDEYENIIQVFKMFDKNQDGTVLASDLRQILSHLGEVIPEDEIDSLFRTMGYGDVIKYEEFAKALLSDS